MSNNDPYGDDFVQRIIKGRRIVTAAGYDFNEVMKHAYPQDHRRGPVQGSLFWSAAVLQDEKVMHYLSDSYITPEKALEAARSFVVKHSLDTATHVRASNGVENIVSNAWPV